MVVPREDERRAPKPMHPVELEGDPVHKASSQEGSISLTNVDWKTQITLQECGQEVGC